MAGWSPAASPGLASAAAHLSVQMTADLGTEQRLAIARTQHSGTHHGHEDRDTVAHTLMPSGDLQQTTRQNLIGHQLRNVNKRKHANMKTLET